VVVGITGGVGQYVGQITKALGAKTVIGIARNKEKLERALKFGADFCINSTDKDAREVSKEFRGYCKENGLPNTGWKIFEVTGVKAGQEIALALLGFTGKLIVVGFGLAKTEYAIGRLMAFDADIIGTWGCLPEYYPIVLDMVLTGKINMEEFVVTRPMSTIAETFEEAHKTPPMKRIVLTPDF
jgi:6-hydroxycyclohex-1-ene-1-carbonyl-CoA dehydrogenase